MARAPRANIVYLSEGPDQQGVDVAIRNFFRRRYSVMQHVMSKTAVLTSDLGSFKFPPNAVVITTKIDRIADLLSRGLQQQQILLVGKEGVKTELVCRGFNDVIGFDLSPFISALSAEKLGNAYNDFQRQALDRCIQAATSEEQRDHDRSKMKRMKR